MLFLCPANAVARCGVVSTNSYGSHTVPLLCEPFAPAANSPCLACTKVSAPVLIAEGWRCVSRYPGFLSSEGTAMFRPCRCPPLLRIVPSKGAVCQSKCGGGKVRLFEMNIPPPMMVSFRAACFRRHRRLCIPPISSKRACRGKLGRGIRTRVGIFELEAPTMPKIVIPVVLLRRHR